MSSQTGVTGSQEQDDFAIRRVARLTLSVGREAKR
ncbi:hypothetical protein Pan54_28640 [Rubinisphaera italica]|uniref:Uncharacterized protein n=1 Tax=Rubinisphaera italica TaxID=2527969 RepID=A0A5C5XJ00_9PLAN|nr:hypothetical protein Pan54_28640 [Rubinisphaera italica]